VWIVGPPLIASDRSTVDDPLLPFRGLEKQTFVDFASRPRTGHRRLMLIHRRLLLRDPGLAQAFVQILLRQPLIFGVV
jgi:hypothetical protein